MDTRNKLLLVAILFATLLPPISLAQDTVSVDEMMRRYELYQQGLLNDDSLNADEVVYTSYGKRRYNGRANWKGLPYTYMLVNNLRTPEYPDKEHFWSFVVIHQKLRLGKVSRLRKRYRRATEHGRKPSRRVRRVIESRAPFVLALDSIDGMRREEWESSIPHDYIIKVKSKKMDYAQAVTKDLKMLDDPFQLLGYDVSVHRTAMRIKEGDIVPYDKGTAPSVRDSSGLMETTLTMMDGTGDSRLRRAINNLADTVNSRLKTGGKKCTLFIKHVPGRKVKVEFVNKQDSQDPDFSKMAQVLESMEENFYPRLWTIDWKMLPGLIIEAELTSDKGWVFRVPGNGKRKVKATPLESKKY